MLMSGTTAKPWRWYSPGLVGLWWYQTHPISRQVMVMIARSMESVECSAQIPDLASYVLPCIADTLVSWAIAASLAKRA